MYIMCVIFCLLSALSRSGGVFSFLVGGGGVGFALLSNFSYYYHATLDQRRRYCVPSVTILFTVVLHCTGMHLCGIYEFHARVIYSPQVFLSVCAVVKRWLTISYNTYL